MDKKEKAILIAGIILLCCCVSSLSYIYGRSAEREYMSQIGIVTPDGYLIKAYDATDDSWISVNAIKILCVPYTVDFGEQFKNILIDEISMENGVIVASPNFGYLTVNETTGMIQVFKWE